MYIYETDILKKWWKIWCVYIYLKIYLPTYLQLIKKKKTFSIVIYFKV